jgi:hypothetical protein
MFRLTLGHFNVFEKIGESELGEVYLTEGTTLERQVALEDLSAGLLLIKRRKECRNYPLHC